MMGKTEQGNDVTLTIDSDVQAAAEAAIAGRKGACVIVDSSNGAVKALASAPTFNNNDIESLLADQSGDSSAMYNRASQALYAPGSTFKILSLASAFMENVAKEDDVFDAPGVMDFYGGKVTNYGNQGFGRITLSRATEVSSNTVYAQVGERLTAEKLVKNSENFMFNKKINFDIPLAQALMPDPDEMTM